MSWSKLSFIAIKDALKNINSFNREEKVNKIFTTGENITVEFFEACLFDDLECFGKVAVRLNEKSDAFVTGWFTDCRLIEVEVKGSSFKEVEKDLKIKLEEIEANEVD